MAKITGVIQDVQVQQRGANRMVDIMVGGEKYGAGLEKFFKGKAGQYVEFELDDSRGYKNVGRNTLKLGEFKGVPEEAAPSTKTTVAKAVSSFDSRQDAISRQAASNTAIAWVTFLGSQGALPAVPKTKGNAQEMLDTLRQEYEKEFYERNTGMEWKDITPNQTKSEVMEGDDIHSGQAGIGDTWE